MNEYKTFDESISIFPNVIAADTADAAQSLSIPDYVNTAASQIFWVKSSWPTSKALAGIYKIEAAKQWKNYSDDPEVATMTKEEIVQAILSMAGKWTDRFDIEEGWLDELREDWGKRINGLFGLSRE